MNGEQKVLSVKIDLSLIDMKNSKQLEVLLLRALNDAQEKISKEAEKKMKEATGGMKIPGLF